MTVTLSGGIGQCVRIHARGRILAVAVRSGAGWLVNTGPSQYEVGSLEEALLVLGVLPDHHRR